MIYFRVRRAFDTSRTGALTTCKLQAQSCQVLIIRQVRNPIASSIPAWSWKRLNRFVAMATSYMSNLVSL